MRLMCLAVCVTCLGLSGVQDPRATGQTRFASGINAVRLDVYVDGSHDATTRLTVDDFEVRDNGVPQAISLFATEDLPINVVVLLDISRSTLGPPREALSAATLALVSALRPPDRVALLAFDDLVTGLVPLTTNRVRVVDELGRVETVGRTGLYDAALAGLAVAEAAGGRTLLLVASDGIDNTSFQPAEAVVDTFRGSEAVVYAVRTGPSGNGEVLNKLAAETGGEQFEAVTAGGLRRAFVRVLERFRKRYLLSFYPSPTSAPGWHDLSVRLKGRRGRVRHRAGYWFGAPR